MVASSYPYLLPSCPRRGPRPDHLPYPRRKTQPTGRGGGGLAPEEDLALEEDLAHWQGRRRRLVWQHRLCNEPPGSAAEQPEVAVPWARIVSSLVLGRLICKMGEQSNHLSGLLISA